MVYKQFKDILAGLGLTEIEAHMGKPFDPNLHHAVMQECAEEGRGRRVCIAEVFRQRLYA